MRAPNIWQNRPVDKHLWAFVYFCRRQGDRVQVHKHGDGTADLYVWRKDGKR